jgi:hypothetical protein
MRQRANNTGGHSSNHVDKVCSAALKRAPMALAAVDHKRVGRRYIVTAFVFISAGRRTGACHAPAAGAAGERPEQDAP